jgi:competence protein ComEA
MDAANGDWRVLEPSGTSPAPPLAERSRGHESGWLWWGLLAVGVAGLIAASGWMLLGSGGGTIDVEARLAPLDLGASPRAAIVTVSSPSASPMVVDVGGAVRRPGVYRLPAGARIADAIEAAGGYGPAVDTAAAARDLNLASALKDGDRVRVPARGDGVPAAPTGSSGSTGTGGGPVDLNTATSAELEALPAIGPATAAKIIAAREKQPFASVDELRGRKLVGEATLAKIRDLVTVR